MHVVRANVFPLMDFCGLNCQGCENLSLSYKAAEATGLKEIISSLLAPMGKMTLYGEISK